MADFIVKDNPLSKNSLRYALKQAVQNEKEYEANSEDKRKKEIEDYIESRADSVIKHFVTKLLPESKISCVSEIPIYRIVQYEHCEDPVLSVITKKLRLAGLSYRVLGQNLYVNTNSIIEAAK